MALVPCFGPNTKLTKEEKVDLFPRIAEAVCEGIAIYPHDEEAQLSGRYCLNRLIGKKNAKIMIDHSEMHHCEDAECSCAA
jgi:hypothetical protein